MRAPCSRAGHGGGGRVRPRVPSTGGTLSETVAHKVCDSCKDCTCMHTTGRSTLVQQYSAMPVCQSQIRAGTVLGHDTTKSES